MKVYKGKAPAEQFYFKDWTSDFELNMCSHSTKGIWIDMLCHMWWGKTCGILEGDYDNLKRNLKASTSDFDFFIEEAKRYKFCDIFVTRNAMSQNSNANIKIVCRRLYKDGKKKESNRLRQMKHRGHAIGNTENNTPVTTHSNSNSNSNSNSKDINSAKADKSVLSDSKHWTNKMGKFFNQIRPIRDKIYDRDIEFNVDQWIQAKVKKQGHPEAILISLTALNKKLNKEPVKDCYAFLEKVFGVQNGNCVNKDSIELHEFYKTMEISGDMEKFIAGLVKGVE